MPNPVLFPPDFPNITEASELEDALLRLQLQQVGASRQQAHNRRMAGRLTINNQNKVMSSANDRIPGFRIGLQNPPGTPPPDAVGSVTLPPPLPIPDGASEATMPTPKRYLGRWAAIAGGRRNRVSDMDAVQAMNMTLELLTRANTRLTGPGSDVATLSNSQFGLFCGGTSERNRRVDRYIFVDQRIVREANILPDRTVAACGNIQNGVAGFLIGGMDQATSAVRRARVCNFVRNRTWTSLGDFLSSARCSPGGAMCSSFHGYAYSGFTNITGNPMNSIDKVFHTAQSVSRMGYTINADFHVYHGVVGWLMRGYLMAGSDGQPIRSNWFSKKITRMFFTNESIGLLGVQLVDSRSSPTGVSTNLKGYAVGGRVDDANPNLANQVVERFHMLQETTARIGSKLASGVSNAGGVSNYGAGFSSYGN